MRQTHYFQCWGSLLTSLSVGFFQFNNRMESGSFMPRGINLMYVLARFFSFNPYTARSRSFCKFFIAQHVHGITYQRACGKIRRKTGYKSYPISSRQCCNIVLVVQIVLLICARMAYIKPRREHPPPSFRFSLVLQFVKESY